MPRYEFRCPQCKAHLELSFSIHEAHQATCPTCLIDMEKQITVSGIVFKGGGWGGKP